MVKKFCNCYHPIYTNEETMEESIIKCEICEIAVIFEKKIGFV